MSIEILSKIKKELHALKEDLTEEKRFSREEALKVYKHMGLEGSKYDFKEFYMGINVELEHGTNCNWNITNDEPIMTAKIALVHMDELPDYYTRLKRMEEEAK